MKIVFLICNEVYSPRVMELLAADEIDYYTRWEDVKGKGHGTDPHLGTRSFPGTNSVLMIAFQQEPPLQKLIRDVTEANTRIARPDDRIRMFQVPLELVV